VSFSRSVLLLNDCRAAHASMSHGLPELLPATHRPSRPELLHRAPSPCCRAARACPPRHGRVRLQSATGGPPSFHGHVARTPVLLRLRHHLATPTLHSTPLNIFPLDSNNVFLFDIVEIVLVECRGGSCKLLNVIGPAC
jgi:hypothetical protein